MVEVYTVIALGGGRMPSFVDLPMPLIERLTAYLLQPDDPEKAMAELDARPGSDSRYVTAGYVYLRDEQGIPIKTFTIPMHDVDRAIADGEDTGFAKIHVKERTDRILGATIVARHAGEMINGITLAMVTGIGLRTLARVIHAYPTQAEAIKMAADAYTRSRLTPRIQSLMRRWLAW